MREEDFASHKELHVVGRVVVEELQECRRVAAEAIFLKEERNEDAIDADEEVLSLGTVPDIVREVERHFAFHAVRPSYLSYPIRPPIPLYGKSFITLGF